MWEALDTAFKELEFSSLGTRKLQRFVGSGVTDHAWA